MDEAARFAGAGPEVVAGWITQMTGVASLPRRKQGLGLIALGLVLQTVANVIALWS